MYSFPMSSILLQPSGCTKPCAIHWRISCSASNSQSLGKMLQYAKHCFRCLATTFAARGRPLSVSAIFLPMFSNCELIVWFVSSNIEVFIRDQQSLTSKASKLIIYDDCSISATILDRVVRSILLPFAPSFRGASSFCQFCCSIAIGMLSLFQTSSKTRRNRFDASLAFSNT